MIYKAVPHGDMPADLLRDLQLMKEKYRYRQHGGMDTEQAGPITDHILNAVAVTGTPDEVTPRLRELTEPGIGNHVLPIPTRHLDSVIHTPAEKVKPLASAGRDLPDR